MKSDDILIHGCCNTQVRLNPTILDGKKKETLFALNQHALQNVKQNQLVVRVDL